MSPVFRHGRLRLYLLKLLDESPRHGYEVIRLLQDRFMGVYAPSPGTIYPRLARLEEDGLVTHEEVDGKKVYSITDKGREEIRSRLGELADLEDELTESLRDVARGISEDVRDTVRTIREELVSAAREFRADGGRPGRDKGTADASTDEEAAGAAAGGGAAGGAGGGDQEGSDEARRIREEARRSREQMRADFRSRSRARGDWSGWTGKTEWPPWSAWAEWAGGRETWGAASAEEAEAEAASPGAGTGTGKRSRPGGPNPFGDLERMAMQFATELRTAAKQAGNLGERSLNDLRDILTETLGKVRDEVFPESDADDSTAENAEGKRGDESPGGTDKPSAS